MVGSGVSSPKLTVGQGSSWYPYYAGYSPKFVRDALDLLRLPADVVVLDPWNGSGTTTKEASDRGHAAIGVDANPALVVIALARLLPPSVAPSVEPLCADIVTHATASGRHSLSPTEPLASWFDLETATVLRCLEHAIQHVLVDGADYQLLTTANSLAPLSSLAAVFYAALFEVARNLAAPYRTSNPTWVRMPRDGETRVRSDENTIFRLFLNASRRLAVAASASCGSPGSIRASVLLGDSAHLPLADSSVDAIVSSPPYCTRIDYVVATSVELAVLGVGKSGLRALRSQMMGTPTIDAEQSVAEGFGEIAGSLLSEVLRHKSRASATYYYKYFVQYFSKMAASLAELRRVAKSDSHLVLVVQDSYYKEVHVDLQGVVTDLGRVAGWNLARRIDFQAAHTMAAVNPRARVYRNYFGATESALVFKGD